MLCARMGRRIAPTFSLMPFCTGDLDQTHYLGVDITSDGAFWGSFWGGAFRREERGMIFAVLWAIRLHCNKVIFKGMMVSADRVEHDVGILAAS